MDERELTMQTIDQMRGMTNLAESQLAVQVALAANVPYCVEGPPGTGKTRYHEALARAMGWPIEKRCLTQCEPSDIVGVYAPHDGEYRRISPPWVKRLANQPIGVVLFEDFKCTPPSLQAPILEIVQDRIVGDDELSSEIRFAATCNPADQSPGGYEMSQPLANRMAHFRWDFENQPFVKGFRDGFPPPQLVTIDHDWETRIPLWQSHIATYLERNPMDSLSPPKLDNDIIIDAWPSPRSWELTCRLLACAQDSGLELLLATATVGQAAAMGFLTWLQQLDLPDPWQCLNNPQSFTEPSPADDHRTYAVLGAVMALRDGAPERWTAIADFLTHVAQWRPHVAAAFLPTLSAERPDGVHQSEAFNKFCHKMGNDMGFGIGG